MTGRRSPAVAAHDPDPGPLVRWQLQRGDDIAACVVSSMRQGRAVVDLLVGDADVFTELFASADRAIASSEGRRQELMRDGWTEEV